MTTLVRKPVSVSFTQFDTNKHRITEIFTAALKLIGSGTDLIVVPRSCQRWVESHFSDSNSTPATGFRPFNAHAGHCSGRYSFGHNSPSARARDVLKPSTDSARP